jgi:glycosyltransferase involved in cell wall biosynthesis
VKLPASTSVGTELRGRDMLCFSHDWSGDPLSKTHLMRLLARDNRILWINSIGYRTPTASGKDLSRMLSKLRAAASPVREVEKNIFVLNPLALPIWASPLVRRLNVHLLSFQVRWAMRRLGFSNPVNWVFNPAAGVLAGSLGEREIIYYCVDEYTAFSGVSSESLAGIEQTLLRKADLVIVSSQQLLNSKRSSRGKTVLVRHGVDYTHFSKALDPQLDVPEEIRKLPRPIIGYFGLMAADWVDVPLLVRVAEEFRGGSLVLLGKSTMDLKSLTHQPNVHVLGRKPYDLLPAYCKGFDVALIPFPISPVTANSNPLKAREYLAAGLPVVSTAVPEVEILPDCLIGRTHEEFVAHIHGALTSPGPSPVRSLTMKNQDWECRLMEIRSNFAMC